MRYYLPPGYDREGIAVDLWLKGFERGSRVTRLEVHHRCVDLARQSRRRRTQPLPRDLVYRNGSAQRLALERLEELRSRASLTTGERNALHLRYYEGLTLPRIAKELGVSENETTRLITSALVKLRDASTLLQGDDNG